MSGNRPTRVPPRRADRRTGVPCRTGHIYAADDEDEIAATYGVSTQFALDDPGVIRMECTGFGLNLVSGNFEFACLIVVLDHKWSKQLIMNTGTTGTGHAVRSGHPPSPRCRLKPQLKPTVPDDQAPTWRLLPPPETSVSVTHRSWQS
jgi:hypothetical protein